MSTRAVNGKADRPACLRITKAKREQFLSHVRDGKLRPEAARAVGHTGTLFRSLCRHDTKFNEAYVAALEQGREGRRDLLRKTMWERALDPEAPGSTRVLIILGEAELPELEHRRRQRIDHTHAGAQGGPVEVTYVDAIDVEIRRLLDELAGASEDPARGGAAPGPLAGPGAPATTAA